MPTEAALPPLPKKMKRAEMPVQPVVKKVGILGRVKRAVGRTFGGWGCVVKILYASAIIHELPRAIVQLPRPLL
jgi:hypothetical protein